MLRKEERLQSVSREGKTDKSIYISETYMITGLLSIRQ